MSDVIFGGYTPQPGRFHGTLKKGGVNTPPVQWIADETLPVLGQVQNWPNLDFVIIPAGRILGARATSLTRLDSRTVVTIANGVTPLDAPSFATGTFPIGYAPFNIYR